MNPASEPHDDEHAVIQRTLNPYLHEPASAEVLVRMEGHLSRVLGLPCTVAMPTANSMYVRVHDGPFIRRYIPTLPMREVAERPRSLFTRPWADWWNK